MAKKSKDGFGREWINENAIATLENYDVMTVRQLFYRLVSKGYPNTMKHYKRVVAAMTKARWDGIVGFDAFIDREREPYGTTEINEKILSDEITDAQWGLRIRTRSYRLNRWAFQDEYVEVWIEKKALQGVFESPCNQKCVGLFACKGYPSLTALHEAKERFEKAVDEGKHPVIIYFGDHDPSGDDIPRNIEQSLSQMGVDIEIDRVGLTKQQVIDLGLPPAPTKKTDSRTKGWDGLGQVELDAVEPDMLIDWVNNAIFNHYDTDHHNEYELRQKTERGEFKKSMIDYVTSGQFETDLDAGL